MTLSVCEEGALGLKSAAQPVKDRQTLSSEGEPISQRIAGVSVHRRPLQEDERGEPVRFTVPNGEFIPSLWCDAYFVSIRPNQVKGWVRHKLQDDRLFFLRDVIRVALFDDRPDSPTYHMLNVFVMSERNPGRLVIIPKGVLHALKNIGTDDASLINLPTRPYDQC